MKPLAAKKAISGSLPTGGTNAGEAANRVADEKRILNAFNGGSEALLLDIHSQLPVQTKRWSAPTFALRVKRRKLPSSARTA